MLNYIMLYYIILYYIILYCIVLYCIVLYCIVLYCIILYYICVYVYVESPRSMLFDAAAFWLYDNRESLMLEDDDEIDG